MTKLIIDLSDVAGGTHPDDKVVVWSPVHREGSAGHTVSPTPYTIPLTDGRGESEVEPGPLIVQTKVRAIADTQPRETVVPDQDEITLWELLEQRFTYSPPVVSVVSQDRAAAEDAAGRAEAGADRVGTAEQVGEWADAAKTSETNASTAASDALTIKNSIPATVTSEVDAQVPPAVAGAIASDRAIVDAAVAAVAPIAQSTVDAAVESIKYYRGTLPDGTDLNDVYRSVQSGVWYLSTSRTYGNMPPGIGLTGALLYVGGHNYVSGQRVVAYGVRGEFSRNMSNFGTTPPSWYDWVNLFRDVDGAVTDSDIADFVTHGDVDHAVRSSSVFNRRPTVPDGVDLNDLNAIGDNGSWSLSQNYTNDNKPFTGAGQIFVDVASTGPGYQQATRYATNQTWKRPITNPYSNPKVWGEWEQVMIGGSLPDVPELPDSDAQVVRPAEAFPDPNAPAESDPTRIVMWGDSLTHAGGVAARLRELLPGSTVVNRGMSGQTALQVAARQGGQLPPIELEGGIIPESGAVRITSRNESFLAESGYPARSLDGTIRGVRGTAHNDSGSIAYYFTREQPGDPVEVPAGTHFVPDHAIDDRHSTQILWVGRNNSGTSDPVEAVRSMIDWLSPARRRVLVLSITGDSEWVRGTTQHTRITRINNELARMCGDSYIDIRRWIIDHGMEAVGLTPTAEDQVALDGDSIPWSMASDGTHFNSDAQRVIADHIYSVMMERGWNSDPKPLHGTGFPEGVVVAPVGSTYTDTAATAGAVRWIKTSGTGPLGWRVQFWDDRWDPAPDRLPIVATSTSTVAGWAYWQVETSTPGVEGNSIGDLNFPPGDWIIGVVVGGDTHRARYLRVYADENVEYDIDPGASHLHMTINSPVGRLRVRSDGHDQITIIMYRINGTEG